MKEQPTNQIGQSRKYLHAPMLHAMCGILCLLTDHVALVTFIKAKVQKRLVNHKNSHGNNKKEQAECETHGSLASVISSPIGSRKRKQYFTAVKLRNTQHQGQVFKCKN